MKVHKREIRQTIYNIEDLTLDELVDLGKTLSFGISDSQYPTETGRNILDLINSFIKDAEREGKC